MSTSGKSSVLQPSGDVLGWIRRVRPNGVLLAAIVLAALVMLPVLAVVSSLFSPAEQSLAHLVNTILPELLLNTFGLIVMVGTGTVLVGTGCAWLVSACRFPGSRQLQWLLLLPLAMPAYIIGYAYTDFLLFAGPLQTSLRELTGWTRNDYWFPGDPFALGRQPDAGACAVSVRVFPGPHGVCRTVARPARCGAHAGPRGPWGVFFSVALPMARPAIVAGAALALMEALADFGTVQYFGVQTFTTCDLPDMVRHGRPDWGGPARHRLADLRVPAGVTGTVVALAARLS
jgi:iron(III) transport system permease protein